MTKEMVFASLHHHSTFSYLDGYGLPETHVARAAELGMQAMALTEHGNITSHVRLEQAGDQHGVKPIFGVELYTGPIEEETRQQKKNHLTVLAEDAGGYRNLLRLVSRGWAEGFYYEPTVSGSMLAEHSAGLVVLSGCSGSLLATNLVGGKNVSENDASVHAATRVAGRMRQALGDAFYVEVQAFPELDKTCRINQGLAAIAEKLGIPLVATLDAHYTRPDEAEMQQILHNVRGGNRKTMEDLEKGWGYHVPLTFGLTDKIIYERLRGTGLTKKQAEQAIRNAREIAERCTVRLPKVENLKYPLPEGMTDPAVLYRQWLNEGWKYRHFARLPRSERERYTERAKYESSLIESQGFVDYFLMVSDIVKFAKDRGIGVGPARGSAAASLVCYLLRITEVNPMLFPTLLFERFIDANRHDLPDIDLDFDDERRHEVREYAVAKYGADRVGNIGTFTRYKGKNSLDDVQRSLYPDDWDCVAGVKSVKELLIERSSGDLRASSTIEDSIEMFPQVKEVFDKWPGLYKALALEGNVKGMSTHAAGLVLANGPLSDFCATYTKTDPKTGLPKVDPDTGFMEEVVSLDKYDAEYLNVLKLDALGLKTIAAVVHSIELMGVTLEELYATPLDDERTIDGFRKGDVVGVFQFDGRAMRSVNAGVLPDNFMEVADVNALARPGPLHSGATAEYIDVKHGRKPATHYHPIVDEITEHTNFQVVYQEQILQVVRLLGEFSWEEAARIRKIISKKRGEQEFNRQRDKFVEGAATHGMDDRDAHRVFNMLATAGAYAFNAAHCVSYGLLAYWCMWIKQYDAAAFYAGMLRKFSEDSEHKKRDQLLRDLTKKEIPVLPLCINNSEATWTKDPSGGLRPGFIQVNGIGEKTAANIIALRDERGGFEDWDEAMDVNGIGPATMEKMYSFVDSPDTFGLSVLTERLDAARLLLRSGVSVQDGPFRTQLPEPSHTSTEIPYERTDLNVGVVWLGVLRERNLKDLFEMHHSKTGEVLDPNTVKAPDLNEWLVFLGEDDTDILSVTIDRWRYKKLREKAWQIKINEDLVLLKGIKRKEQARRAIYITDLWVITKEMLGATTEG